MLLDCPESKLFVHPHSRAAVVGHQKQLLQLKVLERMHASLIDQTSANALSLEVRKGCDFIYDTCFIHLVDTQSANKLPIQKSTVPIPRVTL